VSTQQREEAENIYHREALPTEQKDKLLQIPSELQTLTSTKKKGTKACLQTE